MLSHLMAVEHDRVRWEHSHSPSRRALPHAPLARRAALRLDVPARTECNTTAGKSALAPPEENEGSTRESSPRAFLAHRKHAALPSLGLPGDGGGSTALLERQYRV